MTTCSECERKPWARGLCKSHYERARLRGCLPGVRYLWRREDLIAEVETLLDTDTDESIAARLGLTPAGIAQAMYRGGRVDLARRFWRVVQLQRRSA